MLFPKNFKIGERMGKVWFLMYFLKLYISGSICCLVFVVLSIYLYIFSHIFILLKILISSPPLSQQSPCQQFWDFLFWYVHITWVLNPLTNISKQFFKLDRVSSVQCTTSVLHLQNLIFDTVSVLHLQYLILDMDTALQGQSRIYP